MTAPVGPGPASAVPSRIPSWRPRGRGAGWFGTAALVNAAGNGFFYPYTLVFFSKQAHVSVVAAGTALTVAGLVALPGVAVVGRLVDRLGPRVVLTSAAFARATAFLCLLAVRDIATVTLLATVVALGNRAEQTAAPALAVVAAPEGNSQPWLALSRAAFNAGFSLGALCAGVALVTAADRLSELAVVNAASFVIAGLLYLPLPSGHRPVRSADVVFGSPWRDRSFLPVVQLSAVLWFLAICVELGMPLYVLTSPSVPHQLVGVLFAINTVLLAVLQVPVSGRLQRRSPAAIAVVGTALHLPLFAALLVSDRLPAGAAVAVLVSGMVVYTLGELLTTQALLVLLTTTAPATQRGAYLAMNQMALGVTGALAPAAVGVLLSPNRRAGLWLLLTALACLGCASGLRLARRSPSVVGRARPSSVRPDPGSSGVLP